MVSRTRTWHRVLEFWAATERRVTRMFFRQFADFNFLLLLFVFSNASFCRASHPSSTPPPPDSSFLPSFLPSLPTSPFPLPPPQQLPEELSVWIAALSVQPVRLRDVF